MQRIIIPLSFIIAHASLFGMDSKKIHQPAKSLKNYCLNVITTNQKLYDEARKDFKLPVELQEELTELYNNPTQGLLNAVHLNQPQLIPILIERGGDVDYVHTHHLISKRKELNRIFPLLYKAVRENKYKCAEKLLECGATVSTIAQTIFIRPYEWEFFDTPLEFAQDQKRKEFEELLQKYPIKKTDVLADKPQKALNEDKA